MAPTPAHMPLQLSWQQEGTTADLPAPLEAGCVVTIGNFDGVHRGHQVLLEHTCRLADQLGLPAVALTFDPHPLQVVAPAQAPLLLTSLNQRVALLGGYGMDAVLVVAFDPQVASWVPQRFIDEVLITRLRARAVCVGEDFRFGAQASGTVATLAQCGDLQVVPVPLANQPHLGRLSATSVRQFVGRGELEQAAQVLGRPFAVVGSVERGHQRGRQLGFPTANIALEQQGRQLPIDGVYAGTLAVLAPPTGWPSWGDVEQTTGLRLGSWVPAAVSVGTNPTFGGVSRQVEAYVLGRDDLQLYGWQVGVRFVRRLRPTVRFTGVADLVQAMHRDVENTRQVLGVT